MTKYKKCNDCDKDLVLRENWGVHAKKKGFYVCKPCITIRYKNSKSYKDKRKTTVTWTCIKDKRLSTKYRNFKRDASKRGWSVELSREEALGMMAAECFYCGKKDNSGLVGIDRVDSSKPYLKNNTVSCCAMCNYGKNVFSVSEYLQHCKDVVNYQEAC